MAAGKQFGPIGQEESEPTLLTKKLNRKKWQAHGTRLKQQLTYGTKRMNWRAINIGRRNASLAVFQGKVMPNEGEPFLKPSYSFILRRCSFLRRTRLPDTILWRCNISHNAINETNTNKCSARSGTYILAAVHLFVACKQRFWSGYRNYHSLSRQW